MANYIVQPHSWIEVEGDSMPAGYVDSQSGDTGVIMQPVLTIVPDNSIGNIGSGSYWEYCISAVNFNISGGTPMFWSTGSNGNTVYQFYAGFNGVTLPEEVQVVTFEDSATPGEPGNTVIVKVVLNPSFEMPANDYVIDIDIDGNVDTCINQEIGNFKVILTNSLMPDPWYMEDSAFSADGNTENVYGNDRSYIDTNNFYWNVSKAPGFLSSTINQVYTGVMTGTWSDYKHEQYLQHEKLGLQNPSAIPGCTITPTNSPVVNGGFSQDDGNTWATECVQWSSATGLYQNATWDGSTPVGGLPLYFEWKITPDIGKTVTASDFNILQTFQTHVNSRGFGPGCSSTKDMGEMEVIINTPNGGMGGEMTWTDQWGNTFPSVSFNLIHYNTYAGQLLDLSDCKGFGAYGFVGYGPHTYNRWMPTGVSYSYIMPDQDAVGGGFVPTDMNVSGTTFGGYAWNENHPLWDEHFSISGEYTLGEWYADYVGIGTPEPPAGWPETLESDSGWMNDNGTPIGTGNWWDDEVEVITTPGQQGVIQKRRFNSVQLWILSDQGQGLASSAFFGDSTVGIHAGSNDYANWRSEEEFDAIVNAYSPTMWGDITKNGLLRVTTNALDPNSPGTAPGEGSILSPCGCMSGDIGYSSSSSGPFNQGLYNVPPKLAQMHGGGAAPTVYERPPNRIGALGPGWFYAAMEENGGWTTSMAMGPQMNSPGDSIAGFAKTFKNWGTEVELIGDSNTFPQGEGFLQWPFWNANVLGQGSFGSMSNIYTTSGTADIDGDGDIDDVPSQYQIQEGSVSQWTIENDPGFLPGGNRDCHNNGLMADYWPNSYNWGNTAKIPWHSWTYEIHSSPSLTPIRPEREPDGLEALSINRGWAENGIADNYVEIRNTTQPGAADNELLVRYYISPEYSHNINADWNTYNKALYIQINGSVNDVEGIGGVPGGMPTFNVDLIDQHHSHEDTRTVNILKVDDYTRLSPTNIIRGGFSDQQDITSIIGKVNSGESTLVAKILVESEEGKYFQKIPYLTGSNKFDLVLRSRTSNTRYVFDLMYQNTDSIFKGDDVKIYLNCKELTTVVKTNSIHKVTYGDDLIGESGGSREICVHGDPGAEFELLLTKATLTTLKSDEDGYDEFDDNIISIFEESALSGKVCNSSVAMGDGRVFKQIKQTIGRDGRFYFKQEFANVEAYTQYKIHIKSDNYGSGILEWDVDAGWEDYYTKTLKQYLNPVLTLRATAGGSFDITHYNGAATGFSGGSDAHSIVRTGRPGTSGTEWTKRTKTANSFTVTYVINGAGSKHFTASRTPKFSTSYEYDGDNTATSVAGTPAGFIIKSDWTNTAPKNNGRTEVNITNIRSVLSADGGTSDGICTLSFRVTIEEWGTKNVTMDLDLSKILTSS